MPDIVSDEKRYSLSLWLRDGITEQVDLRPETRVGVIGDGKLGLFVR